jgi:ABC-2 type transport system ATP-binding protein
MIEVEQLTKKYGERLAIVDINFQAERGEILGFLGPNGAGKTTTMRILSGYMPPTAGRARVAGFDVVDQSLQVRRRVGYLPETVPLYPDMVVRDYLKFMADLHHLPDANDRVDEVLDVVRMQDRADGYIDKLSKGQRQRIGLAQALLHEPEVLILDEPTIGLDPAQIIEVRKLIQEIGRERTVLLSTHILSEAQQVCDRILIINKGRIVAEDTPERLQSHLTGAQRVFIRVAGEGDGVAELVSNVPGVVQVNPIEENRLEFSMAPGQDVRPAVSRSVVNAGLDLIELRMVGMSLEDVFLQLTRDDVNARDLMEPGDV